MHIEKRCGVTFAKGNALDVANITAQCGHHADAHVPGNDGIRNALEPSVMEMEVRPAHFAQQRAEQDPSGLDDRGGQIPDFDGNMGRRHDGCAISLLHDAEVSPRCHDLKVRLATRLARMRGSVAV
jgi:hypothetical protein